MTDQEFVAAVHLHGVNHRHKERTAGATGNGDHAGRCSHVATLAEAGKVASPLPGYPFPGHPADSYTPDIWQAASDRGVLEDENGNKVTYVPIVPEKPFIPITSATIP